MERILITGAAGVIGSVIRKGLHEAGYHLYLCDLEPLDPKQEREEFFYSDICDLKAMKKAMEGVSCVIHLAAIPHEDSWDNILHTNIDGTYKVFEAARQMGVKRIIYASSNHFFGFHPRNKSLTGTELPRPDTYYGVSKVAGEALGRFYADKHGLSVACLRIGSFLEKPQTLRHLRTWHSPKDLLQLIIRCIEAPKYHFIVVYGVSANTQNNWDNSSLSFLGYHPQDNAEDYAASCIASDGPIADRFHGGPYCAIDFNGDLSFIESDLCQN